MIGFHHNELGTVLTSVLSIAAKASEKLLAIYDTDFTVSHKTDNSPLTAADMASHQCICKGLQSLNPKLPVLSEESSQIDFAERCAWQQYWLVDPLDGTREFIKRNGEFAINIALMEANQPILGVIWAPVTGVAYSGICNQGAYVHEKNSPPRAMHVKSTVADKITVVGSRSHKNKKQAALLERLGEARLIAMGSALKFCLVAEGKADIYARFGATSEWDTAAGQAIVTAAGGLVVDLNFNPLQYNKENLLNPEFIVIADNHFNWRQYL